MKNQQSKILLRQSDVLRWFFILCGGQLYLNWILLTNPTSKNPLIRAIYGWNKKGYCGFHYETRLIMAYAYGASHLFLAILMAFAGGFFSLSNILVNIYPIIVQIYIGARCWRIKKLAQNVSQLTEGGNFTTKLNTKQ